MLGLLFVVCFKNDADVYQCLVSVEIACALARTPRSGPTSSRPSSKCNKTTKLFLNEFLEPNKERVSYLFYVQSFPVIEDGSVLMLKLVWFNL